MNEIWQKVRECATAMITAAGITEAQGLDRRHIAALQGMRTTRGRRILKRLGYTHAQALELLRQEAENRACAADSIGTHIRGGMDRKEINA